MTPNDKLVKILKIRQGTGLVNKLLRISDRELALSMMYMHDNDRQLIFEILSAEKVKRIRSELLLHNRLQIRYMQYRMAIDHVLDMLTGEKAGYSLKSYLKPKRYKR